MMMMQITPLGEDEWVNIPDAYLTDAGLHLQDVRSEHYYDYGGKRLRVEADDSEVGICVHLDAEGVKALRLACDRWLAAQEEAR